MDAGEVPCHVFSLRPWYERRTVWSLPISTQEARRFVGFFSLLLGPIIIIIIIIRCIAVASFASPGCLRVTLGNEETRQGALECNSVVTLHCDGKTLEEKSCLASVSRSIRQSATELGYYYYYYYYAFTQCCFDQELVSGNEQL